MIIIIIIIITILISDVLSDCTFTQCLLNMYFLRPPQLHTAPFNLLGAWDWRSCDQLLAYQVPTLTPGYRQVNTGKVPYSKTHRAVSRIEHATCDRNVERYIFTQLFSSFNLYGNRVLLFYYFTSNYNVHVLRKELTVK